MAQHSFLRRLGDFLIPPAILLTVMALSAPAFAQDGGAAQISEPVAAGLALAGAGLLIWRGSRSKKF